MAKLPWNMDEQREMLKWLKNGKMPTKYLYFGVGAKRFNALSKRRLEVSMEKDIHVLERVLLTQKVGFIFDSLTQHGYKNFNIIDIGVGDGSPVYPILQYLKTNKPNALVRYNPTDISEDMIAAAAKNLREGFGVTGEKNKFDLDKGDFSKVAKSIRKPNFGTLFMFLGATLSNMPDMHDDLVRIRKAMMPDEYFLVGVELLKESDIGTLIQDYYGAREIWDFVFTPFEYMGVRQSHCTWRVIFDKEVGQLEGYITPDKDYTLELAGERFIMKKNKPIMVFRSFKYRVEYLVSLFVGAGFRIELLTTSKDNKYALILVQPVV